MRTPPWRLLALVVAVLLLAACASQPPATEIADQEAAARGPTATRAPDSEPVETAATEPPPTPTATDVPPTATATAEPEPSPTATEPPPPTPAYPDLTTLNVIATLNRWRLDQGLWPLRINDTLTTMANDHADYLLSLPSLFANGDIHAGRSGENPRQRAQQFYGWPHYSNIDQVAVGEIAYAGASLDAAVGFWRTSDIHARTVVSPGYREIGVAVKPYAGGNLYIVVFGSQPGVMTALYDPATSLLYMSSERYRWSMGGDWIHEASQVQVVDPPDGEINAGRWLNWLLAAPPPASGNPPFRVAYNDGTRQTTISVDPGKDIAWLPSNLSIAQEGGAPLVAPTRDASAPPTATPLPPTATAVPPTAAPTSTPPGQSGNAPGQQRTPQPTATAVPPTTVPPTATSPGQSGNAPGQSGSGRGVTVIYDEHSLSIVATSPGRTDISRLELRGSGVWLPISRWSGSWLKTPLTDFSTGSCVQTWAMNEDDPGEPPECKLRQSATYQSPQYLFWTQGDFEVAWDGMPVATCQLGAGRCEVPLP